MSLLQSPSKCSVCPEFIAEIAPEGLEVAALVPTHPHGPSCGKNVRNESLAGEMTTEILKSVLAVVARKFRKGEANLADQLLPAWSRGTAGIMERVSLVVGLSGRAHSAEH